MSTILDEIELETNPNDASFDARKIPSGKSTIRRGLAGLLAAITLFSGSVMGATQAHAAEPPATSTITETTNQSPDTIIEIPECYQYEVYNMCGKNKGEPITIGDLNNATDNYMSLSISGNESLEWLNYLKNVEFLSISMHTKDTSAFKDIRNLTGFKELTITTFDSVDLTKEDFSFLKNSKDIKKLNIYGFNIEPGILEELTNLETLRLVNSEGFGIDEIDYSKLTYLDELEFPMNGPYDMAISLTKDAYQKLKQSGVKITFEDQEDIDTLLKVNEKLDSIVESLDVDKKSSDIEKLDAVLVYVLEHLEYDETVSSMLKEDNVDNDYIKEFYEGGRLYGALEKNSAICGNYAALTEALLERLGVENFYLSSTNHAWNLVEVDGDYYYVDSTWLDGKGIQISEKTTEVDEEGRIWESTSFSTMPAEEAIKNGRSSELEWYMEDPNNYPESKTQKESHIALNFPSFIQIKPVKNDDKVNEETTDTEVEEDKSLDEPIKITDDDKFEITAGGKKWLVGGGVAIGLMAGLGAALVVSKKKKEAERRRRMSQYPPTSGSILDDDLYQSSRPTYRSNSGRRR